MDCFTRGRFNCAACSSSCTASRIPSSNAVLIGSCGRASYSGADESRTPSASVSRGPLPVASHSMRVRVVSQTERRSVTLGSDSPRSHFLTAPSERSMALASPLALPYASMTSRKRAAKPPFSCLSRLPLMLTSVASYGGGAPQHKCNATTPSRYVAVTLVYLYRTKVTSRVTALERGDPFQPQ